MSGRNPEQEFGDRLKRLMREHRETGRSLADSLGVHETTVSGWVRGRMRPEYDRVVALAAHFGVTERWLMDGDPSGAAPARPDIGAHLVREKAPPPYRAETSVQSVIAAGQRHLSGWLAEYSARLLEAAASDARRQLAAVISAEAEVDLASIPHEGGTPELKAAIDAAVVAQVKAQEEAARRAGKGASGAGKARGKVG